MIATAVVVKIICRLLTEHSRGIWTMEGSSSKEKTKEKGDQGDKDGEFSISGISQHPSRQRRQSKGNAIISNLVEK